jgi:hypothetical protein
MSRSKQTQAKSSDGKYRKETKEEKRIRHQETEEARQVSDDMTQTSVRSFRLFSTHVAGKMNHSHREFFLHTYIYRHV